MRIAVLVLVLIGIAAAGLVRRGSASTTANCLDQVDGQVFLQSIRTIASDPELQETRDSLNLPALPDSVVQLVSSDSVCAVAAQAFATRRGDAVINRTVWVVSYGPDHYVVMDPTARLGEWADVKFFTKLWAFHDELLM